jgi:KaiC/GvpD/RAD55 family RecA-like ATPase
VTADGDRPSVLTDLEQEESRILLDLDRVRAARALVEGGLPTPGLFLSYGEVMRLRAGTGPRFPTGFSKIDQRLDGGLFAGNFVVIQGPPGGGKSMLATQLSLHLAPACAVAVYFSDEGNASAAVTIAQQLGQRRTEILRNDPGAVAEAVARIDALPFYRIVDHFHRAATLEQIVVELDAFAPPGLQRVLLLDSAQTLRLAGMIQRESPVERVQRASRTVFELTRKYALITFLVTRINRASFGKKNEADLTDPIAAAWGGGMEWDVDLMLHLENKGTELNPKVRAQIPKNRISGWTGPTPLVLDWARKRFLEEDEVESDSDILAKNEAAVAAAMPIVEGIIRARDGVSWNDVRKDAHLSSETLREARVRLLQTGKIHSKRRAGRGGGELWYLGPSPRTLFSIPPDDDPQDEQEE